MKHELSPEEQARYVEAARWLARLQRRDCTAAERVALQRWQAADPANAVAYAEVEAVYRQSAQVELDPAQRTVVDAMRAKTARRAQQRRIGHWSMGLGVAAVLMVAIGIGWRTWDPIQSHQTYASRIGEQQTVTLDDGSGLLLDTDSSVEVQYSRKRRNVVLERGQAQFTVAAAPERPFVVQAGEAAVRAIGTQFQVRRDSQGVQVSLLEGVVEVTASPSTPGGAERIVRLAPGEQLALVANGRWATRPLDRESTEGWTRGELVFRQASLSEVVAEMNRYTPVKLRLADPTLNEIRLSGVFYGNDQDSLVDVLQGMWPLRAEHKDDEILIHRR